MTISNNNIAAQTQGIGMTIALGNQLNRLRDTTAPTEQTEVQDNGPTVIALANQRTRNESPDTVELPKKPGYTPYVAPAKVQREADFAAIVGGGFPKAVVNQDTATIRRALSRFAAKKPAFAAEVGRLLNAEGKDLIALRLAKLPEQKPVFSAKTAQAQINVASQVAAQKPTNPAGIGANAQLAKDFEAAIAAGFPASAFANGTKASLSQSLVEFKQSAPQLNDAIDRLAARAATSIKSLRSVDVEVGSQTMPLGRAAAQIARTQQAVSVPAANNEAIEVASNSEAATPKQLNRDWSYLKRATNGRFVEVSDAGLAIENRSLKRCSDIQYFLKIFRELTIGDIRKAFGGKDISDIVHMKKAERRLKIFELGIRMIQDNLPVAAKKVAPAANNAAPGFAFPQA